MNRASSYGDRRLPSTEQVSSDGPIAVTRKLLQYCRGEDWAGYDPYDALNSRAFDFLPFLNFRAPRLVMTQVLKRISVNVRPLLMIPKMQNPKGIALFLMSFIRLSRLKLLDLEYSTATMVDKLVELRSTSSTYWCWGYSFPWQTRTMLVPRRAPNLVCTVFAANALLDVYEYNGEQRCLDMAASAAHYILAELFWEENSQLISSFSYPVPMSRTPVHNANLLGAALLFRVYRHFGDNKLFNAALKVARYSAAKQHEDGSWDYGESFKHRWVDNFHTGYNLCALQTILDCTNMSEFESYIHRGFDFYRNHFFRDDGAPRYFHDRTYPIDVHSVAQSIITLLAFRDLDQSNVTLAFHVFNWAKAHMWDERGYFYYQVNRFGVNRIPYMRWAQAWMLVALSSLLNELHRGLSGTLNSRSQF